MKIYIKLIPYWIKKIIKKCKYNALFVQNFKTFIEMSKGDGRFTISWDDRKPQFYDNTTETYFDTHYIYHPAWASRIITKIKPDKHIDIGSTLSFCSILSAFIPVDFYDYRPARLNLSNLNSKKGNLYSLPFADNTIQSISCLHTIEHIGLGRYGDPIDPTGDIKAINELIRVVANGGNILFVVPIGKPKILFNAHRIYSYNQIMDYFKNLELIEFSLIPDNAFVTGIISNADPKVAEIQNYGCGCFWFKKIKK